MVVVVVVVVVQRLRGWDEWSAMEVLGFEGGLVLLIAGARDQEKDQECLRSGWERLGRGNFPLMEEKGQVMSRGCR